MWCSALGCIVTLILSLLAMPLAADAQPAAKIPRVGVLRPGNPPPGDYGQREAHGGVLRGRPQSVSTPCS
jgi:hypothetical protein